MELNLVRDGKVQVVIILLPLTGFCLGIRIHNEEARVTSPHVFFELSGHSASMLICPQDLHQFDSFLA